MSNAIHVIRLRQIWARMHASVYSANTLGEVDSDSRRRQITQLRDDLEKWKNLAPPCLSRPSTRFSIFSSREWFELNYSGTILLLYRGQLAEDKGTANDIFMDCVQAASTVCHIYRRLYVGTSVKYTWATLHCLFLAGLTYLHCLWTSPHVLSAVPHSEVIRTCTDCTMVLVVIAEGWEVAASYRDIFEALTSQTVSMVLESKLVPQQSQHTAQNDTSNLHREDLSWMTDFDFDATGILDGFGDLLSGVMSGTAFSGDEHILYGTSLE